MLQGLERSREQPVGEGVVHEKRGHPQKLHFARMLDAETLERTEVVAITECREELFQDRPVAVARGNAEAALEMILQILLDPVIVEQRVVHIDEEDDWVWHDAAVPGAKAQTALLPFGSSLSCN